jgi:CubicO group peptidase (beta-lactamase class C family)
MTSAFRFRAILPLILVSLGLPLASPAQTVAPAPPPSKTIAATLQPFVDSHAMAGAVTLVASQDKVLSLEAVGFADIAANRPMQTDNLFWIASMSKPMTTTALMMLVDEGKVNVDDPVEKYLPEFRGQMLVVEQDGDHALLKKPAHPITVKNVLTHTSGLPFLSPLEQKIDSFSLRESVVTYALGSLKFPPDTKYVYSNEGINTAARIIEVVSGVPYEEFIDSRLFKPLGMKDTTFWPTAEQVQRLAKSYKPNSGKPGLKETDIHYLSYPLTDRKRGPCPAGGLFSTATDVSIFCRMILGGGVYQGKRYLSDASLRQMTSTQSSQLLGKKDTEAGYGFGWATTHQSHATTDPVLVGPCGHGGAFATDMWIDPQHQLITVFMVQHNGFGPGGSKILPAFKKAALEAFSK